MDAVLAGAIIGAVGGSVVVPLLMYGMEYAVEGTSSAPKIVLPWYIGTGFVVGADVGAATGQLVKDQRDHSKHTKK